MHSQQPNAKIWQLWQWFLLQFWTTELIVCFWDFDCLKKFEHFKLSWMKGFWHPLKDPAVIFRLSCIVTLQNQKQHEKLMCHTNWTTATLAGYRAELSNRQNPQLYSHSRAAPSCGNTSHHRCHHCHFHCCHILLPIITMFVVLPPRLNPEVVHFATGQLFGAEARILIGFILGFSSPSEKT